MKRRPNFVDLSDASGTAQHAPALLFAALGAAGRRFTPTTSPFGSKADLLCECAPSFGVVRRNHRIIFRSEEHTSELQSLMRISYAVFCLKKKTTHTVIIQEDYTDKDLDNIRHY